MKKIELKISVKAGGMSIDFESQPDDVLHGISVADFTQRLMELAGYVAPVSEAPPPTPPSRPNWIPRGDGLLSAASAASVDSEPVLEVIDGDDVYTTPDGQVVHQRALFARADDVLSEFIDTDL